MKTFQNLSLKAKVLLLPATFFVALTFISVVVYSTISRVKVGGPEYSRVASQKDLLADTIPPPGYILEAFLYTHLMDAAETDVERERYIEKFKKVKDSYQACLKRWSNELPEGEVKTLFTLEAQKPATEFFNVVESDLIPALRAKDEAKVDQLISSEGPLYKNYELHAAKMDSMVSGTEAKLAQVQSEIKSLIASRTWFLFFSIIVAVAAASLISAWIFNSISKQEAGMVETAAKLNGVSRTLAQIEFHPDGTVVDCNESFEKAVGYKKAELVGKHHSLLVEDSYRRSPEYSDFWARLNRGEAITGEIKRIGNGGKVIYLQATYAAVADKNGKVYKVVKFAYDVTPQVQGRLELAEKANRILEVVEWASQGDLTKDLTVSGDDSLGRVGTGLSSFFSQLRKSLGSIADNATALAGASEELSAVSTQMSSNAEETSSQATVVSAASEQVSQNVLTVSTGVDEMNSAIREIAKNATDAARISQQAVSVANRTNITVSKLGESSAEIGKVVKVITSIAEQTNLLALNATIEAARAGEAGKGFAVVANEVKELAKETAKATEDISHKIETIQLDTQGAVEAIRQISEVINQVNDISSTIASAVEEQTATAMEMGRNVGEASKGTSEIAQNITVVATASQSTTQGACNVQQAASELSRMADDLQKLVNQFKFQKAGSSDKASSSKKAAIAPVGSFETSSFGSFQHS